uniref:GDT1 family protein n=1 Tax=Mucochytrium quahogii TaxID=96639 RepID=A0A7S2WN62_9STRA|mmetsp:Transcript_15409/g.25166  ORF Transcript_15409/g.25166 Transcript_15409/m.25166 type:complete len:379 (-) Transcript_15409:110-1246(-)
MDDFELAGHRHGAGVGEKKNAPLLPVGEGITCPKCKGVRLNRGFCTGQTSLANDKDGELDDDVVVCVGRKGGGADEMCWPCHVRLSQGQSVNSGNGTKSWKGVLPLVLKTLIFLIVLTSIGAFIRGTLILSEQFHSELRSNELQVALKRGSVIEETHLNGSTRVVVDKGGNFVHACLKSLTMIVVSELGDETFIIAAIMAMRHPQCIVFTGSVFALYLITILSSAFGFLLPIVISLELTQKTATFMYFFFGVRLVWIGCSTSSEDTPPSEMVQVEKVIISTKRNVFRAYVNRVFSQTLLEAFLLTFLAEWGDRSQIATITLASHSDPYGVTVGAFIGHTICTAVAVLGGRLLASQISQKTVALAGACTFFVFGIVNLT